VLGLCADPKLCSKPLAAPGSGEKWQERLATFKPPPGSVPLNGGIMVGAALPRTKPCLDIFGHAFPMEQWPLGAIGLGSL
jgi:hypothetical protein